MLAIITISTCVGYSFVEQLSEVFLQWVQVISITKQFIAMGRFQHIFLYIYLSHQQIRKQVKNTLSESCKILPFQ